MKNLDDNGSFDKMVEKAREDAKGDDELLEILLTERVVNQFFLSMIKKNPTTNKLQESASPNTPPPPSPHVISTTNKPDDKGFEDMHRQYSLVQSPQHYNTKKVPNIEKKNKGFKVRSSRYNSSKKKVPNNYRRMKRLMMVPENPQLPAEFKARIEAMNGTEIKLVIQKPTFPTDLNPHHERLSIPRTQIISKDFLKPEEEKLVQNYGIMDVKLIGPRPYYKSFELKLKKWDSNTSWSYSLTTKSWPDFIRFYTKKEKIVNEYDVVQIWSFRINSKLHLALVKVEDDNNEGGEGGGGGAEGGESGGSTQHERRESSGSTYEKGESSGTKYIAPAMEATTTQISDQAL